MKVPDIMLPLLDGKVLEKRDLSLPQTTQLYIDKIIALSPEINIALIPSNNDGTRTVNR